MRISVDKRDRGHQAFLDARADRARPIVMLDGREVKHVVTADDESGEVVVEVTDERGRPVLLDRDQGTIARRTLSGSVRIVLAQQLGA